MIAFAGSAFASNEVILENCNLNTNKQIILQENLLLTPCIVEIWGYNAEGEYILKRSYKISIYPYNSCEEAITAINKTLNPRP